MDILTDCSGSEQGPVVADSHWRFLFWVVLAALVVRLVVVALVYKSFLVPEREHWLFGFEIGKIAESIALGHGFGNLYYGGPTGPTAEIAPLQPFITAGVFKLFGIYTAASAFAVLAVNSVFSALTCIPIFFMAKDSFGIRQAQWAACTWAGFPYAIYFSADSMWNHALLTLFLTCTVWVAMRLPQATSKWSWAGFGVLAGLTAMTDPVALGMLPFLAAWAYFRARKGGRAHIRQLTIAAVGLCVVVGPWLMRNYRVFHRPVFLQDDFPLAFCVGNLGDGSRWWNPQMHPSGSAKQMDSFHRVGEQTYMANEWMRVRSFITNNPELFVWRSVRRFVYMWTGYWSFSKQYLQEERYDPEDIPFCAAFTLLALFGVFKMLRKNSQKVLPYALVLVIFPLAYYVTEPDISYREPVNPEVVILACCGLVAEPAAERGRREVRAPSESIARERLISVGQLFGGNRWTGDGGQGSPDDLV